MASGGRLGRAPLPDRPAQLAEFTPEPLAAVMLEDPRLSSDPDTGRNVKVVLEYKGPFDKEVRRIGFLDGNSNQGDALCYEPVRRAPRYCR